MTTQTEALKLALEELENCADLLKVFEAPIDSCVGAAMLGAEKAVTAIKEALAQPEQEPVAWTDELEIISKGIKDAIEENGGFWRSCTGCYETNEGYPPNGAYFSKVFKCYLGNGCDECGGIGAIWDDTDYEEMAEYMMQEDTHPQQKAEQEPVAWVYPEGLEALKAGKPWTAYGTRQEPNNTALYLSPQPDITPYAWVTFTPYGDEDDVWYENPEGQLLEGWTYKPLYDTTPPQRKPLTVEKILHLVDTHVGAPSMSYPLDNSDWINFARAIEAAHSIKE